MLVLTGFAALVAALVLCVTVLASAGVTFGAPLVDYWKNAPNDVGDLKSNQHTVMYDRNGHQFAEVWSEDRKEVSSLDDISQPMRDAIVSAEDKNFYNSGAVDILATLRSAVRGSGGGSGITQQLIKNLQYYASNATDAEKAKASEPTLARKARELKMAMSYSRDHSKDEILLEYLNTVAVGTPNTYGIETASELLFNKPAKELDIAEAATLAGSVNNPSLYNVSLIGQSEDTKKVVGQRRDYVLGRMLEDGKITRKQYDEARKEELRLNIQNRSGSCGSSEFPFYCQYVINYLLSDPELGNTPEERQMAVTQGGFSIQTALDPEMTRTLENQLKSDWGTSNRVVDPTAVVQPGTGQVLAIGVNRDWGEGEGKTQIVLADSGTQTGSTYKMMTLAAALNAGYTEDQLNSISAACPWSKPGFDVPSGGMQVSTSCSFQGGHLTYRQATAYSSNVWFAELESRIGVMKVKEFSDSVGLNTPDDINERSISYTLGVTDNSPIDMAAAYATFANKGVYCPATPVTSIKHMDGSPIVAPDEYDPATKTCRAVMSPHSAGIVLKALDANVNAPDIPARFGSKAMISGHDTGGKSGTTDSWANSAWAQVTGQYSVFADAYDPRGNFQYPLWSGYYYRGAFVDKFTDGQMLSVASFLRTVLANQPNVPLDFNDPSTEWKKTTISNPNMITIPDFTGLDPDSALRMLSDLGLRGGVMKTTAADSFDKGDTSMPEGIIVKQSMQPGTQVSVGSSKEIQLYVIGDGQKSGSTGGEASPTKQETKDGERQGTSDGGK